MDRLWVALLAAILPVLLQRSHGWITVDRQNPVLDLKSYLDTLQRSYGWITVDRWIIEPCPEGGYWALQRSHGWITVDSRTRP